MRELKFRVWNKTIYPKMLKSSILSLNDTGWVNINKETNGGIDQYTGLKDKNGKEIYEGDIFKDDNWCVIKAVVDFNEGMFGWWTDKKENFIQLSECKIIEVIGNIYENKDLLE